jgi:hypothetical protein
MAPTIYATGETTVAGPALTSFNDEIFLAWPAGGGMGDAPASNQLNVKHGVGDPSGWKKTVLAETSRQNVSLTGFNGRLYLAWAGDDGVGSLNLISSADGENFSPADKQTLGDTCLGGPSIVAHRGLLVRAWAGGVGQGGAASPNAQVNLAWSSDGTTWPDSNRLLFNQTAVSGPAMVNVRDVAGDEYLYLAWTDLNQQIYVTMTTNAQFGDLRSKVVPLQADGTGQTAVSCPGLSTFNSGFYASPDNVALVWPGTDSSHKINLMTANVANTEFGYKRTWDEYALFNVALLDGGSPELVYAYHGTDLVEPNGQIYYTIRNATDF